MHQAVLSNSTTAPVGRVSEQPKSAQGPSMSDGQRAQLRAVMALAWRKLRWEWDQRRGFTMSAALKHAWAWFKGAPARAAAEAAWANGPKHVTHLRSILRSPIQRSLDGQNYAGALDYSAARLTARFGR